MNHQFDTADAEKYGIPAAVILNHFRWWIERNRATGINLRDGRHWTYSTYSQLADVWSYMTVDQIRYAIGKLTDDGVIIKGDYNENKENRTIWYAFEDESTQLGKFPDPIGKIPKSTIREDISSKITPCRFDEFWTTYPKKVGKADALRLWKRRGLDSHADKILTALAEQVEHQYQHTEKKYLMAGDRYLRGEHWEDEITHAKSKRDTEQDIHREFYRKVATTGDLGSRDFREDAATLRHYLDETDRVNRARIIEDNDGVVETAALFDG